MNTFELKNISYTYPNGQKVLENISLDIKKNDKIAILGPNGCGKTTLLSILNALIVPQYGEISYKNTFLNNKTMKSAFTSVFRKEVGYVFQNPDVQLFCPNVYEELEFGPKQFIADENEKKEAIEEIIEQFGLQNLLDKSTFNLSYGEKKRVLLASILVNKPDVIIFDEPTTGLDPKNKRIITEYIQKIQDKTLIIATHDYNFAETTTEKCIVLDEKSNILHEGKTADIIGNSTILKAAGLY